MGVVLVHGAWHGPWAWDGVVAELERLAACRSTPSSCRSPASPTTRPRRATRSSGPAPALVVCGHSYGGFVISAAARGLPVGHLVYLCAFMVDEGEEPFPLWFSHPVPLHGALRRGRTGGRSSIRHGRRSASTPTPTTATPPPRSPGCAASPAPVARRSTAPTRPGAHASSTYVVCGRDQAIHPEVQRTMARHADHVVEWDADHSPFLSDPARVATLLAELAAVSATP